RPARPPATSPTPGSASRRRCSTRRAHPPSRPRRFLRALSSAPPRGLTREREARAVHDRGVVPTTGRRRRIMKARSAWIVTGALGAVGLGATVATAQGVFDAPEPATVSPSVEVGTPGSTSTSSPTDAPTSSATPSPTDVQNGTSITTVTANTSPSPNTSGSPVTSQTANTAPTPNTPNTPNTANTPNTPNTPPSPVTPPSPQSAD